MSRIKRGNVARLRRKKRKKKTFVNEKRKFEKYEIITYKSTKK